MDTQIVKNAIGGVDHQITVEYLKYGIFGFIVLALLMMHILKWPFIKEALSEGNTASSKRLGGYILVLTVALCEMFSTIVGTASLDWKHLVAILVIICLCWSIATSTQVLSVIKGRGGVTKDGSSEGDGSQKASEG